LVFILYFFTDDISTLHIKRQWFKRGFMLPTFFFINWFSAQLRLFFVNVCTFCMDGEFTHCWFATGTVIFLCMTNRYPVLTYLFFYIQMYILEAYIWIFTDFDCFRSINFNIYKTKTKTRFYRKKCDDFCFVF